MEEEIAAFNQAGTWTLVDLLTRKKAIGCKWVLTPTTCADSTLDRLKARLVAKGYAQTYGVDYFETFSPGSIPFENPIDAAKSKPFENPEKYQRLIGKLNYLTVTHPDITYPGSLGCGILYRDYGHIDIECFCDTDHDGSKATRRSTTGYCIFVGGNLVSWRSKKQNVVSQSSAETAYRAMAQSVCEIVWIHQLLKEDKIKENFISTKHVRSNDKLGDLLTKALNGVRVDYLCNELGMIDIYAPI
ncbi:uncharacterized protein LOC114712931 [Neltuma alba]|uniref:uncharacterized protein LOC114712931 n=1 Tax=Neltuma alba TaxID=207710 RepID=UPI0010A49898|nr:uncharacterized protein LOC114712931 [Prosopis alba]